MEWGIKLKNNDILKRRFIRLVGKIFIVITISLLAMFLFKRLIEILDFQWIYNISSHTYYRLISLFYNFYYNGIGYLIISILIIVITLVLVYFEIKDISSYVQDIYDSTDKLFDEKNEYISLPGEMKDLEIKLNHFRSESFKNKKLAYENEKKKDELIVYLAHDIKTPLTVVIGYLSLLNEIDDMPRVQRKKYLELVLNKSYRLEELINELFDIARFNSEKIILEKEDLDIRLMLEQIIDDFYPVLVEQEKNINLNQKEDITLYGDADKLSRVFSNVIKNAISYSKDHTDINIDVHSTHDDVIVKVINKGKEIPKEKLNRIFENFYRLDSARTSRTGGSGLGLAIAKEIVELHHGSIFASSNKEETVFTITLPKN